MTRRRFSEKAYLERLLEFSGKCACCGCKVGGPAGLDWDHVIPLAMGGDDDIGNLEPLCRLCHRAKTKTDVGHIAKAKRMQKRGMGIKRQSRGGFREWRNFRGEIVKRGD